MMTTLYLVRATHPTVPGEPTSIHFTRAAADAKATELTLLLVADCITGDADATDAFMALPSGGTWQQVLENAQLARCAALAGCLVWEVDEGAFLSGDREGYLSDESGADVWVEKIEADMPLPRVFVETDNGRVHRITVDTVPVDMLSLGDGHAISCPAMCEGGDDRIDPKIADAFARYWQPVAPETPNAG